MKQGGLVVCALLVNFDEKDLKQRMNLTPLFMSIESFHHRLKTLITDNPLFSGDIHLWFADLRAMNLPFLLEHLTPDEQVRAKGMKFDKLRSRFMTSHAAVRYLLSVYLQVELEEVTYQLSKEGKPALTTNINSLGIDFNFSHTHDFLLVGISSKQQIGVDLEIMTKKVDFLEIAKRFFSSIEYQQLSRSDVLTRDFYRLWTAKEAIVKAAGLGISAGLESFTVLIDEAQSCIVDWNGCAWYTQWIASDFPDSIAALSSDKAIKNILSFYLF
jgi:4'-phosphopantetheinyl transferase